MFFLKAQRGVTTILLLAGAFVLVTCLDVVTGPFISMSVFYLVPVLYGTWIYGRNVGVTLALTATTLWTVLDKYSGAPWGWNVVLWNAVLRLVFLGTSVLLLARVRTLNRQLEQLLDHRTDLLQVEILQRELVEREMLESSLRVQTRIAEDLHDGLGQYLTGLAFRAKNLCNQFPAGSTPREEANHLVDLIQAGVRQVKQIARGLAPIEFDGGHLATALERLVKQANDFSEVSVSLKAPASQLNVSSPTDIYLFRIAQEALANATRHGKPSRIDVELSTEPEGVCLRIEDDGSGFDRQNTPMGMGQKIMRHRAERVGGEFQISSKPGAGTQIVVRVPYSTRRSARPELLS